MPERVVILLPVYNDWQAASQLLRALDAAVPERLRETHILIVDDGSTAEPQPDWIARPFSRLTSISVLRLLRNLGHQRAIAIGLVYVQQNLDFDALIVMDADGEDRPVDVEALLEAFAADHGRNIIFAARTKRLESATFRLFYQIFRGLHLLLTGMPVRVGNFSAVPPAALSRLMVVAELWNHYAAAVFRARLPNRSIPLPRGSRLAGESRMNFVSLLVHGLSAISVFSDVVSARLLAFTAGAVVVTAAAIGAVFCVRFTTDLAIPGWASYTVGILLVILAQAVMIALVLVFTIISSRANMTFLPSRDAGHFIGGVHRLYPSNE